MSDKLVPPERIWVSVEPGNVVAAATVGFRDSTEYIRADAFPDHIGLTFKHMQEQIAKLKTRVAELDLTEHCGRIEL
jgi:hypothetical protein